jgi:hypothetical protein
MTSIDTLARNSAAAIHTSVAFVPVPVGGIGPAAKSLVLRRSAGYAFAGATAAVLAVVAMLVVATPSDEVTDLTPTTVIPSTTIVQITSTTIPGQVPDQLVPIVPVAIPLPPGDVSPPAISIVSPDSGSRTTRDKVSVTGIVEVGATVTAPSRVRVVVSEDGVWSVDVPLSLGENELEFKATDEAGNTATASIVVFREAPLTTTTTTKPLPTTTTTDAPSWTFTASNTYGSCAESPPYDVYYGTGKPGTEINIVSEYGSGSTTVNGEGDWELKVYFESAPAHVGFSVYVKDFQLTKKTFDFIYTPE